MSTPLVFKTLNLPEALQGPNPNNLLSSFQTKGALIAAKNGYLFNDLQPPAFSLQPKLKSIRDELSKLNGCYGAMMSGSGKL